MKNKETLLWMLRSTGRSKYWVLALVPMNTLLSVSSVVYALLMKRLVDSAVGKDVPLFFRSALFIVALLAVEMVVSAGIRFLHEWSRSSLENSLKSYMFELLLRKDYAQVSAVHSGEWMSRLTNDVTTVTSGMVELLPSLIGTLVGLVGAAAALIVLEPLFAAVLLPGGALLIAITYAFRKLMKRLHKQVRAADGAVRVFLQEHLGSLLMVRAFGMEDVTVQIAREKLEDYRKIRIKRNHFSNLCNTGFGLAACTAYMGGAIYCGFRILTDAMSYGTMMAVMDLAGQVQSPFASLTGYLPQFYAMTASAERLMEVEDFAEDGQECRTAEEIEYFYKNKLCAFGFENACFTYRPPVQEDGREMPIVLENLSFSLQKGEYVAIMGHSGCGKSTILKLLMGIYPLDSGEGYLTTTEEQRLKLTAAWRGLFAYVPQGNQLMSGSLRSIITFGDPQAMQEEARLRQALEISCAAEFVDTLTGGLDTVLGERGAGLSEGQMQRIAIARSVFSSRPILLLDEATSALDEATEARLLTNLRKMTDKTVIIVTHRPAVLSACDKAITVTERCIEVRSCGKAATSKS